jgi:hypothetical protein
MNAFETQLYGALAAMEKKSRHCRRVTMAGNAAYAIESETSLVAVECIERVGVGIRYGFRGCNVLAEACGQLYLIELTRAATDAIKKSVGVGTGKAQRREPGIYWSELQVTCGDFKQPTERKS